MNSNITISGPTLGPIVNEILCWIQNMINVLPQETVVKLSEDKFEEKETNEARDILLKLVIKDNDLPMHKIRCTKAISDTKVGFAVKQIYKIFQENSDISDFPIFVAQHLYRLPPIALELCDVSGIILSLKNLEIKAASLSECAKYSVASMEQVISKQDQAQIKQSDILNRLSKLEASDALDSTTSMPLSWSRCDFRSVDDLTSETSIMEIEQEAELTSNIPSNDDSSPLSTDDEPQDFSCKNTTEMEKKITTDDTDKPVIVPSPSDASNLEAEQEAELTSNIPTNDDSSPLSTDDEPQDFSCKNTTEMEKIPIYKAKKKITTDDTDKPVIVPSHSGKQQVKCNRCVFVCVSKEDLIKHMDTHSITVPYYCSECVDTFVDENDLRNHMLTHTGEKWIQCTKCDNECYSLVELENHMLTHTR